MISREIEKLTESVLPDRVLSAFKKSGKGVMVRQVRSSMLEHDLADMKNPKSTYFKSATLLLESVPVALIGDVYGNEKWAHLSGIILRAETKVILAEKVDASSEALLDEDERFLPRKYSVPLTQSGEIDIDKMISRANKLRKSALQIGAKPKRSLKDLRAKLLEQRERIDSKEDTYVTTSGKIKKNNNKQEYKSVGYVINNECLTLPILDDIIGIYFNTRSPESILEAIKIKKKLTAHGLADLSFYSYNPTSAKMDLIDLSSYQKTLSCALLSEQFRLTFTEGKNNTTQARRFTSDESLPGSRGFLFKLINHLEKYNISFQWQHDERHYAYLEILLTSEKIQQQLQDCPPTLFSDYIEVDIPPDTRLLSLKGKLDEFIAKESAQYELLYPFECPKITFNEEGNLVLNVCLFVDACFTYIEKANQAQKFYEKLTVLFPELPNYSDDFKREIVSPKINEALLLADSIPSEMKSASRDKQSRPPLRNHSLFPSNTLTLKKPSSRKRKCITR